MLADWKYIDSINPLNNRIMDKQTLLAFMVWAIEIDALHLSFEEAWKKFQKDAIGIKSNYTNPTDECMYIPSLVNQDPIEFFTDYILFYAKMDLESNKVSSTPQPDGALYGKYETDILNYKFL